MKKDLDTILMVLPSVTSDAIRKIAADNLSGALRLTERAASVTVELAKASAGVSSTELISRLRNCTLALVKARPSMAPIFNLANDLYLALDTAYTRSEITDAVDRVCAPALSGGGGALPSIAREAAELIGERQTIMTISNSSTVLSTIGEAWGRGRDIEVLCLESRPMNEGRTMAEMIAGEGVKVRLVTDATVGAAASRVDLVLVGADAVSDQGVVNKMGTLAMALAAEHYGVDRYALCSLDKFLPSRRKLPPQEVRDPAEVLATAHGGIEVVNLYFDLTPLSLFTGFVTERGVLGVKEAMELMEARECHPLLLENG